MLDIAALTPLSGAPAGAPATAPAEAVALAQSGTAQFSRFLAGPGGTAILAPGLGERFEASVLTPLVAAILPPEDSMVWGGPAGRIWRGLFAEQLAAATAASGGVGIASMIDQAVAARAAGSNGGEG